MVNVVQTDFSENNISLIETSCFHTHQNVANINLSANSIRQIKACSFVHLFSLAKLDLSKNPLQYLAPYFMINTTNIHTLQLLENQIHHFGSVTFQVLQVRLILTQNYKICCVTHPNTTCEAQPPWFMSCSDLLPTKYLKVLYCAISVVVFLLNAFSLISHPATRSRREAYLFLVVFVNITDMMCATYLLTIWISDLTFKGTFVLWERIWRSGMTCHFAFAIIITYTVNIQFVLLLLSLSRMMAVIYPVQTPFQQCDFVMKILSLLLTVSSLTGILLTFTVSQCSERLLPISLCLPFVDPTNSLHLIKAIVWFTLISQTITSAGIIVMHTLLLQEVKATSKLITEFQHRQKQNIQLFVTCLLLQLQIFFVGWQQILFIWCLCFSPDTPLTLLSGAPLLCCPSMPVSTPLSSFWLQ